MESSNTKRPNERCKMELDKFCRFCGGVGNSECIFFPLTEAQKDTLEIITSLEHIDTDGTSLVCENCVKDLKMLSEFKRCCFKIEESIAGLKPKNNDRLTLEDIVGVGLSEQEFATRMKICRFCLQMVSIDDSTRIGDSEEHLLVAVKKYIPEMNLNLIDDPVICGKCSTKFSAFYKFSIKTEPEATENLSEMYDCGIVKKEFQIKNEAAVEVEEPIMEELTVKINQFDGEWDSFSNIREDEKLLIDNIHLMGSIKSENDNNANSEYEFKENSRSNTRCGMSDSKATVHNLVKTEVSQCSEEFDCDSLKPEEMDIKDVCLQEEGTGNIIIGREDKNYQCGVKTIGKNIDKPKRTKRTKRTDIDESLITSYTNETGETLHRCAVCLFERKNIKLVRCHLTVHRDPKDVVIYPCKDTGCTYKTKYKSNLTAHLIYHGDPNDVVMYPCTYTGCTYKTKFKSHLKTHLIVHKDRKDKKSLPSHLIVHGDPNDVVMYPCTYTGCTFQTKYKSSLTAHLIIHKDPKDLVMYPCTYTGCTYKAKHKNCLRAHLITHRDPNDVVMYPCTYTGCTYKTKSKNNLRSHLIVHRDPNDVVMYPCPYTWCTFKTKHKSYLTVHIAGSHDGPILKCFHCSFSTKYKHSLKNHVCRWKKYKCDQCSFQSKNRRYFRNHLKIHKSNSEMCS